jgi:hypothetical protein
MPSVPSPAVPRASTMGLAPCPVRSPRWLPLLAVPALAYMTTKKAIMIVIMSAYETIHSGAPSGPDGIGCDMA